MDAARIQGRLPHSCWLVLLRGVMLVAPSAGLIRFENCGTAVAAEPQPAAQPPDARQPGAAPAESAPAANAPEEKEKRSLRVVDDEGSPVAKFNLVVWYGDEASPPVMAGSDGRILQDRPLWGFGNAEALDVTLSADGYASTFQHFSGAGLEKLKAGEVTLVLHRGDEVQVNFRLPPGMTWPDGLQPEFYFDSLKDRARVSWSNPRLRRSSKLPRGLNVLGVHARQPATATLRLSAETAPFRVMIDSPGFLQFFERGPFALADVKNGKLAIDIEKPASLDVQFDPTASPGETLPIASSTISVRYKLPGTSLTFEAGNNASPELDDIHSLLDLLPTFEAAGDDASPEPEQHVQLSALPAGEYVVNVQTKARPEVKNLSDNPRIPTNPGVFSTSKKVTLAAGQSERIDVPYTPFDPEVFKGDRTAVLHILKADGSTPKSQTVTIVYIDEHYGPLPAFSGTTSESGIVTVPGITDRKREGAMRDPYMVSFGGKRLGRFGFTGDAAVGEFTFHLPPAVGDVVPDVVLTNISTGAAARLSDFRGKVVCLDFWATWCGPCQEPLHKMNRMSADRREAWKDRVVIVPISIDDAPDLVTRHVTARGWTNLEYYWSGDDGIGGWESPAPLAFGIHGVPTSFIIDRDGKVLWRGHPAPLLGFGASLEQRIEAAIEK